MDKSIVIIEPNSNKKIHTTICHLYANERILFNKMLKKSFEKLCER